MIHTGKQCLWIAKSTNLLVGPKPIDRTQDVRLFCAMFGKHTRNRCLVKPCTKGLGASPASSLWGR